VALSDVHLYLLRHPSRPISDPQVKHGRNASRQHDTPYPDSRKQTSAKMSTGAKKRIMKVGSGLG
jgi:hypothetical protein